MSLIYVTKPKRFENVNPTGNGYEVTIDSGWEVTGHVYGPFGLLSIHTTKHWFLIPKIYIAAWIAVIKHLIAS